MEEYKKKGQWHYKVERKGNITARSTGGYKKRTDMRNTAIHSSIDIMEFYVEQLEDEHRERLVELFRKSIL